VVEKTRGNPFFVNNFLLNLYEENLIYFIYPNNRNNLGEWQWNLEEIKAKNITENLVDFLSEKIKKLTKENQDILKIAACIGIKFNLEIIALITHKSLKVIADILEKIVKDGFIFKLHNLDISVESDEFNQDNLLNKGLFSLSETLEYQFAHDRIHQVVYSLISPRQKTSIHYEISQLFINNLSLTQQETYIFDLVNQFNQAVDLLESPFQKKQLAQFNLMAGKKAKLSAAYQSAFEYLQIGLNQLNPHDWNTEKEYQLILEFYMETAELAYLCGDFSEMETLLNVVIKNAHNLLDKVKAYQIKIQAYIAHNQLQNSLDLAINTLKQLKVNLPSNPNQFSVSFGIIISYLTLKNKEIKTLIDLPTMEDPFILATVEILTTVGSSAYLAKPNLVPIIVLKQIHLFLQYGNNNLSAYAYTTYGVILSFFLGKIEEGYQFGKLALQLLDKYPSDKIKAKTILVFNDLIRHWKEHLNTTLQPLLDGYIIGLETGDLEFASLCANAYCYHSYFVGKPLQSLKDEVNSYKLKVSKLKQNTSFCLLNIWEQTITKLRDIEESFFDLSCCHPAKDKTILFVLNFNELFLSYIFGDYERAIKFSDLTAKYLDGGIGVFTIPLFYYYDSLARLANYHLVNSSEQKKYLKQINIAEKKIKKWAQFCPDNHLHRLYLIQAEKCRVLNQKIKAIDLYDQGIFYAQKNQYIQDEALANEKAGEFYLKENKPKFAQIYLWEAYYHYERWGALHKAKQLQSKYPQFIDEYNQSIKQDNSTYHLKTSSYNSDITLDLKTVMKANQTISCSLILEELLTKLMEIVIENVGAELGYLILENKGKLLIEAQVSVHCDQVLVLQSIPIENSQKVSETIIKYVARTHETVILHRASDNNKFSQDPYIIQHKPKSLLALPLLNQNQLIGIIYLENNLTAGAFTPNRIEMLNLLSAQIAISIKNSQLYNNLNTLNLAYERFIPRQFINLLQKDSITEIELGDNIEQKMSVLFCDIRSFTTMSEKMTPEDNFKFINGYLSRISPAIREYNGFIDKYIGDGIMALFSGKADNAVKAGIKMLQILMEYNSTRQRPQRPPINIGIGINTGNLMLGTVGEENRMDGTVISDSVNLASRIEGLTKNYGVSMLITQKTLQDLTNPEAYSFRFIDQVMVKGKSELITIYEVFDGDQEDIKQQKLLTKDVFEKALHFYHQGNIQQAIANLKICLDHYPEDCVVKMYLQRCENLTKSN
jgi:predicted ATPase/class 3 adenylate cyclase